MIIVAFQRIQKIGGDDAVKAVLFFYPRQILEIFFQSAHGEYPDLSREIRKLLKKRVHLKFHGAGDRHHLFRSVGDRDPPISGRMGEQWKYRLRVLRHRRSHHIRFGRFPEDLLDLIQVRHFPEVFLHRVGIHPDVKTAQQILKLQLLE